MSVRVCVCVRARVRVHVCVCACACVPALALDGLVWVGLFGVDAVVVLDILEGVVHESAVAAVVPVRARAVHQVLFAQRHQDLRLAVVLALQSAGLRDTTVIIPLLKPPKYGARTVLQI